MEKWTRDQHRAPEGWWGHSRRCRGSPELLLQEGLRIKFLEGELEASKPEHLCVASVMLPEARTGPGPVYPDAPGAELANRNFD